MDYISHTKKDIEKIKNFLDIDKIEDLLKDIPKDLILNEYKFLNLARGKSEFEIIKLADEIQTMNNIDNKFTYLGAGIYNHFIPSVVDALASRVEFLTAYTPYQAEISQGTLQWIFEYQSSIANLTGMEIVNASLYDAANSLFEAVKIAIKIGEKNRNVNKKNILISKYINPEYLKVLKTSFKLNDTINRYEKSINIIFFENFDDLSKKIDEKAACVIISNPNFLGQVENIEEMTNLAHQHNALSILNIYPISLGILKKPGEMDVDIVTGEGQSLGMPMCIGGATFGIFATKKEFIRLIPGRIVGKTTDKNGKEGFVLTMQAREQHIRREKAFSNICSNHANYALRALIYLSALGDKGLETVAILSMQNAYYFAEKLLNITKSGKKVFNIVFEKNYINEFVLEYNFENFEEFDKKLKENDIVLGLKLNIFEEFFKEKYIKHWLVCATELNTKENIDETIKKIQNLI
ncbi:MAG: aminomethyl-transferring glycine dehydrogenase subunit GcvPA [Elusimicrobiota bacterium]|jgi:glycine dehydrogenase subunit 1|nr:aminomethyl-transferring glycine dehydrogenase subunit GcvPA [Elusimicrobiota bacterium]